MAEDRRLRVLILSQYFYPEPELKGLPLANALVNAGHDVLVLTGFPNYPTGKLYPGYRLRPFQVDLVDGIQVIRVGSYLSHNRNGIQRALSHISFAVACLLALPRIKTRPEAIYIYNLVTLVPVAVLARWFWQSRIILDVQDLWPESVAASGMLGGKAIPTLLTWLCDTAYRAVDLAIVQSPGFLRRLAARGVSMRRLQLVYNWAPGELTSTGRSLRKSDATFHIVYAGTIGTVQALHVVLDAAAICQRIMPNVRFTLIGSGSDFDRLQGRASSLENVEFHGWMSQEELEPHLRSASALLLHLAADQLFFDTIPSKLQQYLLVGRPILCGVAGDAAEVMHKSGGGITFIPEDSHDLVRAVQELQGLTEEQRDTMGRSGAKFYRDYLSREKGLSNMVRLLTEPATPADNRE